MALMNPCGVIHPESGLACELTYNHPEHQVWVNAWLFWPNEAYRAPQPAPPRGAKLQQAKEFSRQSMAAKMPVNREKKISVAPSNGTPTSDAAAQRIAPMLRGMKAEIYAVIAEHGPITCDAVEVLTGGKHQTVSARFNDLVKEGLIEDTGETALTRSRFSAALYRVVR